jgi:mono/diheme cytochrome c family protein
LALALFVVGLAYLYAAFVPARLEPRAAPGDVDYVPRPEWYFLWLFQFGKYVESQPWLRSLVLPALIGGILAGAPYLYPAEPRRRAAAAALGVLCLTGLTGLARYDDRALPNKPSYEEALAARAAYLYGEECSSCHGKAGKGDGSQARSFGLKPPDFTAAGFWRDRSDATMRESIRSGKGDDMPAFQKKMSAEEIDALIALVKLRFGPTK